SDALTGPSCGSSGLVQLHSSKNVSSPSCARREPFLEGESIPGEGICRTHFLEPANLPESAIHVSPQLSEAARRRRGDLFFARFRERSGLKVTFDALVLKRQAEDPPSCSG